VTPHPIFFIRHGETQWNMAGRLQGRSDSPLTPRGREQAARNGETLLQAVPDLHKLRFVASPLGRTRTTMEIVRERLEREFNLELISTAPNVIYEVTMDDGTKHVVTNPSEFPGGKIAEVQEPVVRATILSPSEFVGTVMELCQQRRGNLLGMDYLSEDRVEMRYTLPLAEIVFDFFDQLKSRTRGFASLDYETIGDQVADLVKVDILLHGDPVDAFSAIVHKDKAYTYGVMMASKLKELIPRQQFEVPIQAAIGARVIARETIRAIRKDVLAKCYGGDISRKRKLLEKQKEGKKRMKMVGRVEVPQEAFIAALSTDDSAAKDKTK
jgi:GTP-binding protein LepA